MICYGETEKKGGLAKPCWVLRNFKSLIDDCQLSDIGFDGYPFTWCNQHDGEANVQERLDRALATETGALLFPLRVVRKVKRLQERIDNLGSVSAAKCEQEYLEAESNVQRLKESSSDYNPDQIREIQKQLHTLRREEEIYWYQKSRVQWLRHGDKNSKFFHASTIRRRRNHISSIENPTGQWNQWIEEEHAIQATFLYHFLFQSQSPSGIE
ncbi:uncharacterized protein LOC132304584 [Cornus florida]|uniref:uncharacterized protein LOC132304584 n=1 Tax=Cornus florida TaxID=4283 RepID=UPI0028A02B21|nr:uncharacterized protein LOC132304584 [Cornus florida]